MGLKNNIDVHSVWISDTHIGSCGTQLRRLDDFLDHLHCNLLFLNGDILDKYLISNIDELDPLGRSIIDKINHLHTKGVRVYFLPGNHDSQKQASLVFKHLTFVEEFLYKSLKNKTFLVMHGDKLDPSVSLKAKWFAKFGTDFYEFFLKKKNKKNRSGLSLSRCIKISIKNTLGFLFRYRYMLHRYLVEKKVDGLIYGHTHQPKIKTYKSKLYLNSGDWIDNCSYIVETHEGEFKLLNWE